MTSGKESARDKRYGRRGGRWATLEPTEQALDEIHTVRLAAIRSGTWPDALTAAGARA